MRITPLAPVRRRRHGAVAVGLVLFGLAAIGAWSLRPSTPVADMPPHAVAEASAARVPTASTAIATDAPRLRWVPAVAGQVAPAPQGNGDPNDLAHYIRPGDPAPSGAAVIKALQQSGIRTGIAAFNPPGTMPFLSGLAVPEDFPLPEGYVRHHQVTDDGVPIEPILMFAPDAVLRDATGRVIALPADRIVPPELAPPGLPLRWVRPGSP